MRVRQILGVAGLVALAACSQPKPPQSKAYFSAHPDERAATLAACREDPGQAGAASNCANASAAAADAEQNRFWSIKRPKSRVANPGSL
jgi:uncharacterized protein YecT (DUF1311 family)